MSENLSNCHVCGFPTHVLEPEFKNTDVKIPNWDPRIQRGGNMVLSKIHSTKVGLVLNLLTGSISPQYHIVFDDMFSTVVSSTSSDPEVWIKLFIPRNSRIHVMLDQGDGTDLDDEWLTANKRSSFLKNLESKL